MGEFWGLTRCTSLVDSLKMTRRDSVGKSVMLACFELMDSFIVKARFLKSFILGTWMA